MNHQQQHNRIDFGTKVTSWRNQPIGPPITNKRVDLSYHRIAKIPRKDRGGSRRYTFRVKLWVLANSDDATLSAGFQRWMDKPNLFQLKLQRNNELNIFKIL